MIQPNKLNVLRGLTAGLLLYLSISMFNQCCFALIKKVTSKVKLVHIHSMIQVYKEIIKIIGSLWSLENYKLTVIALKNIKEVKNYINILKKI